MQFLIIAFLCIAMAGLIARRGLPLRRAALLLLLAALVIGLLDGLGFLYVEFHANHGDYFDARERLDVVLALQMFALAAVPAALLSFALSFFAWLVFRPIFGGNSSPPDAGAKP
jgi:hypothetical protein